MVSGINFLGSYSGIDMDTIDQLMQVEAIPLQRMSDTKERYRAQKDAWRDINTRLKNLYDRIKDLSFSSTYFTKKAETTQEKIITAAASTNAVNGTYQLSVQRLASAAQITSGKIVGSSEFSAVDDSSNPLGISGSFKIEANGNSRTIVVTENDSLKSIVDKINALDNNVNEDAQKIKISATVIDGRLQIVNKKMGSNPIILKNTDDTTDGGFLSTLKLTETSGAEKTDGTTAKFTINDLVIDGKDSNTISDVLEGVTFTLKGVSQEISPGVYEQEEIVISDDTQKAVEKIQAFVEQYNSTLSFLQEKSSLGERDDSNPENPFPNKGVLAGDPTLTRIIATLRHLTMAKAGDVASKYTDLSQIGIKTTDSTGKLTVDTAKLTEVLKDDPLAVKNLLYGETNVARISGVTVTQMGGSGDVSSVINGDTTEVSAWSGGKDAYIQINFGTERTVEKVKVYTSSGACLNAYTVQQVDGSYTKNITGNTNLSSTAVIDSVHTSAIRIRVDDEAVKDILEVEVYEDSGIGVSLAKFIDEMIKDKTGAVSSKQEGLEKSITRVQKQMESFTDRLEMRRQSYIRRFTALDVALRQIQAQTDWLTNQIAGLNNFDYSGSKK